GGQARAVFEGRAGRKVITCAQRIDGRLASVERQTGAVIHENVAKQRTACIALQCDAVPGAGGGRSQRGGKDNWIERGAVRRQAALLDGETSARRETQRGAGL